MKSPHKNTLRDLPLPELMDGQWLEHPETKALYIVPTPEAVMEIEGPDDSICDALNAACRKNKGVAPSAIIKELGLDEIPNTLRRYNGHYYHA